MTSKKQKERKKKRRQEIAKSRVLKRREALRRQKKQAIEDVRKEAQAEQNAFGKLKPFVKNDARALNETIKQDRKKMEEINSKLEHNLKILEALEEEYDKENELRKEINTKLENEGHMTMKDKMDALHKKALELEGVAEDMESARKEFEENSKEIVIEPKNLQQVEPESSQIVEENKDSSGE
jgi:hypothetical protein